MEEGETRKFSGVVSYVAEIKKLGEKGKLLSRGFKLDGNENWLNVVGFNERAVEDIFGDIKKGDAVYGTEKYSKGYWNVSELSKGEREIERVEYPIELDDEKIMDKCMLDAEKSVRKHLGYKDEISGETIPDPRLVADVAIALFKHRTNRE